MIVFDEVVIFAEVKVALEEAMFKPELVLLGNRPRPPRVKPVSLTTTPVAKAF